MESAFTVFAHSLAIPSLVKEQITSCVLARSQFNMHHYYTQRTSKLIDVMNPRLRYNVYYIVVAMCLRDHKLDSVSMVIGVWSYFIWHDVRSHP